MSKLKKVPKFKSEREELEFWATHDSTEYIDYSRAKGVLLPNLKPSTKTLFWKSHELMDIKKQPNHRIYIQVLRQMSSKKRLLKAFELSEFTNHLFIHGLRKRFSNLSDEEFKKILLERLGKCHNRNY